MGTLKTVVFTFIVALAFIVLVLSILPSYETSSTPPTAKAFDSATLLCINNPPNITISCPSSFNQSTRLLDNRITCDAYGSDVENGALNVSITQASVPPGVWAQVVFGELRLNASQQGVGSRSITITVADQSSCQNNHDSTTFLFDVLDINDPPWYHSVLPSTTFISGNTQSPYSLKDYFSDPDNDELNFSVIGAGIALITINQLSGDVEMTSEDCGTDYVLFRATDPGDLYDESDPVEIVIECASEGDDSGSGGSGGGSGGGDSPPQCFPKWQCNEWSSCYINGTQMRRCLDLNGCKAKDYERYYWKECTYIPSCFDGVQNGDETGIDCGGSCTFCGTCTDGLLNQDEEDVDCGGTSCDPCFNCADGIKNWGETGIDCGGKFCPKCESCYDGVQNQDETGIDCGGGCSACLITEIPAPVTVKDNTWLRLILIVLAIAFVLAVLYRFFRKYVNTLLAKIGWLLTRKRHKDILLNNEQKNYYLHKLRTLVEHEKFSSAMLEKVVDLSRSFMSDAYSLPFAYTALEAKIAIKKHGGNKALKSVMTGFIDVQHQFETKKSTHSHLEIQVFTEEVHKLILQTSHTTKEDMVSDLQELEPKGNVMEQAHITLLNAHLALQWENSVAAQKHYMKLLDMYEKLSEKEKTSIYLDIQRVYNSIKYLLSYT